MLSAGVSLHLVEHIGEGGLQLQSLLDLVGTHKGVFAVFKEARALMLADELNECRKVRFPILGKALEVFEDSNKTRGPENCNGILGVFVEVRVEDALIQEVGLPVDLEEVPAQIVQLEYGETSG